MASGPWVFDDPAVCLVKEPLVPATDWIIDRLVEQVPDAHTGFTLIFSELPLPGEKVQLPDRELLEWHGREVFKK